MNRNLDGSELTRAQLIDLAIEAGMPATKVTLDTKTWVFHDASRSLRFEMWARGELLLDTRPVERPATPVTVDPEMVAFLTRPRTALGSA